MALGVPKILLYSSLVGYLLSILWTAAWMIRFQYLHYTRSPLGLDYRAFYANEMSFYGLMTIFAFTFTFMILIFLFMYRDR